MVSKLVVCLSGSGTNFQAIMDAIASKMIADAEILLVVSNKKDAYGLQRARDAGIESAYLNLVPYGKKHPSTDPNTKYGPEAREAYDADLAEVVLRVKPDMVVLAGFMHILSETFLTPLAAADVPILNLHPALPGEFDGANAIQRAYDAFQQGKITRTGLMIHYVIREVDRGAPVVTQEINMQHGESLHNLEQRMHAAEHQLIVKGISVALQTRKSHQKS